MHTFFCIHEKSKIFGLFFYSQLKLKTSLIIFNSFGNIIPLSVIRGVSLNLLFNKLYLE